MDLDPASQRRFAYSVVEQLRAAGYVAYWAGGCVRDQLLGATPKDYDVATNATPDAIRGLFGKRRTIAVGAAFGVITILGGRRNGSVEVATFRRDALYSDGRHPDAVVFSSPEEDAARRDFTINGLFYDPVDDQVIDFVGGQDDLNHRIIRAIGDPHQRLAEDKLRMLRAIRFTTTLDFAIDAGTKSAIRDHAPEINTVSAERIGIELRLMLLDVHRARALELLASTDLLRHLLPELAVLHDVVENNRWRSTGASSAWQHTLAVSARLIEPSLPLALAAVLHCVSEERPAARVGQRLRFTNKEIARTTWLLDQLPVIADAIRIPWPRLQRTLIHPGILELLAFRKAILGGEDAAVAYCRAKLALPAEQWNPRPLINGNDLIAHGLVAGRHFTELLERVRDAQLDGKIRSKDEALQWIDRWMHDRNSTS
ncbi:MAG: CCA tRNA nucleotidyltransferase [Pirellulales bacterium]|nr:CCA tRNA nucleotidyltransferase [Pirellulales bacterium]